MKESVKGFKGFDKDFKCLDMQYAENKEFSDNVEQLLCNRGFHFCEMPLDVFEFYPPNGKNVFAEVEAVGTTVKDEKKSATNKMIVGAALSVSAMFKAHFSLIFEKITASVETTNTSGYKAHANTSGYKAHANTSGNYAHANTSGYKAHANTAGNYAHANTSGNYAHANTSGYKAHANTAGHEAHANTSGYKAHANTAGNYAHANTAGNYAHANTSGNYAHANTAGHEAIACSLGIKSKSKAVKGWIVIVDWKQDKNYDWHIHGIYSSKVGGEILGTVIESDIFYWFEGGELKSDKQ